MNETELRLQYAVRTWDYKIPASIDLALADDYVRNSALYTDDTLEYARMIYRIYPNVTPHEMISMVRGHYQNEHNGELAQRVATA